MEIHQLTYFVRVAETLNFTRAAADLSIAQPSLSQQIRKLERELGFALFDRRPDGVRLTPEGALFLPHVRSALDRIDAAAVAAQEIRGVQRGLVTVGISPFAGARLLPPLVRLAREQLPGVTVRAREDGLSRLLGLLETGDIDLALALLPAPDPNLITTPLLAERLVVVTPISHPLASCPVVDLADLRNEPFVLLTPAFGLRQLVDEECARVGFSPRVAFESGNVGVILGLVEEGLGVTILPESAVRSDQATVVRPVVAGGSYLQRRIGLAHRRDRYVPLAARRLFALADELSHRLLSGPRQTR